MSGTLSSMRTWPLRPVPRRFPLASVLGHTYAARSHDALGQFDRALGEYQTALAGWNTDYGTVYSLHRRRIEERTIVSECKRERMWRGSNCPEGSSS